MAKTYETNHATPNVPFLKSMISSEMKRVNIDEKNARITSVGRAVVIVPERDGQDLTDTELLKIMHLKNANVSADDEEKELLSFIDCDGDIHNAIMSDAAKKACCWLIETFNLEIDINRIERGNIPEF